MENHKTWPFLVLHISGIQDNMPQTVVGAGGSFVDIPREMREVSKGAGDKKSHSNGWRQKCMMDLLRRCRRVKLHVQVEFARWFRCCSWDSKDKKFVLRSELPIYSSILSEFASDIVMFPFRPSSWHCNRPAITPALFLWFCVCTIVLVIFLQNVE